MSQNSASGDGADSGSTSLFYVDKDGRKRDDGLHGDDVPGDPHGYAEDAMLRALKYGGTREQVFQSYGPKGVTFAEHEAEMARRRTKGSGNGR